MPVEVMLRDSIELSGRNLRDRIQVLTRNLVCMPEKMSFCTVCTIFFALLCDAVAPRISSSASRHVKLAQAVWQLGYK